MDVTKTKGIEAMIEAMVSIARQPRNYGRPIN